MPFKLNKEIKREREREKKPKYIQEKKYGGIYLASRHVKRFAFFISDFLLYSAGAEGWECSQVILFKNNSLLQVILFLETYVVALKG